LITNLSWVSKLSEDLTVKKAFTFFVKMNDHDLTYIYTRLLHRYQDDLSQVFDLISKKFTEINEYFINTECSSTFHSNLEDFTGLVFNEVKRRKITDPVLNPL
jgi:hypothetical protein